MKKINKRYLFSTALVSLFWLSGVSNMSLLVYKIDVSKSKITILGTSNVHNWETYAENITGTFEIDRSGKKVKVIKAAKVTIPVTSIGSGKRLMDSKTYDALKADKYPFITFVLKNVISIDNVSDAQKITAAGTLSIAGVTKNVTLNAMAVELSDGRIRLEGTKEIVLSDFGIEPPTAMFGALKTGGKVSVQFTIYVTK